MALKKYTDIFFRDVTSIGGIYLYMIIALIFLFVGNFIMFLKLSFGVITSFIIAVIIRLIYFKERPRKEPYNNLFEKIDAGSFPSIHSARISFLFLVLSDYYQNIMITIFLFITSALVVYSRIYLKKHDVMDVTGGVIIGLVLGYLVMQL